MWRSSPLVGAAILVMLPGCFLFDDVGVPCEESPTEFFCPTPLVCCDGFCEVECIPDNPCTTRVDCVVDQVCCDGECQVECDDDCTTGTVVNCSKCGDSCGELANIDIYQCSGSPSHCEIDRCDTGYYDLDGDARTGCEADCAPTGPEQCNGIDDDCNDQIDDLTPGEIDDDCDRQHPNSTVLSWACASQRCEITACIAGYADIDRYGSSGCEYACTPTAPADEVCDLADNDCNGITDDVTSLTCSVGAGVNAEAFACIAGVCRITQCLAGNTDTDGVATTGCETPGCVAAGIEDCATAADDDCNGSTNEEAASGCTTYYADVDGDGLGDPAASRCMCSAVWPHTTTTAGDCDDNSDTCGADCVADLDGDGEPDCRDTCLDGDGDGYGINGVIDVCTLGADCDDALRACNAACVDADGDHILDCLDICVDRDRDGRGVTGGAGVPGCVRGPGCCAQGADCYDNSILCGTNCNVGPPSVPACMADCLDRDGDSRGVGGDCTDVDCDDDSPTCGPDCDLDVDGDGVPACRDCNDALPNCWSSCVDADGDGVCQEADCDDQLATQLLPLANYYDGPHTWLVPPGVTSVRIFAWGGGGGGGGRPASGGFGGAGGFVTQVFAVTADTQWTLDVGGGGGPGEGVLGNTPNVDVCGSGGGGGGATTVRDPTVTAVVVAGGGGGGGAGAASLEAQAQVLRSGNGGVGGSGAGQNGAQVETAPYGTGGGFGGAGATGGTTQGSGAPVPAGNGASGVGGAGAGTGTTPALAGGSPGGGASGGGRGNDDCGGGGGGGGLLGGGGGGSSGGASAPYFGGGAGGGGGGSSLPGTTEIGLGAVPARYLMAGHAAFGGLPAQRGASGRVMICPAN